jgi:hypothetical protein
MFSLTLSLFSLCCCDFETLREVQISHSNEIGISDKPATDEKKRISKKASCQAPDEHSARSDLHYLAAQRAGELLKAFYHYIRTTSTDMDTDILFS